MGAKSLYIIKTACKQQASFYQAEKEWSRAGGGSPWISRRQDRPRRRRLPDRQAERRRQQELPPRGWDPRTDLRAFGYARTPGQTILPSKKYVFCTIYLYHTECILSRKKPATKAGLFFVPYDRGRHRPGGTGVSSASERSFPWLKRFRASTTVSRASSGRLSRPVKRGRNTFSSTWLVWER